jgi:Transglycosylase SLT domain
VLGLAVHTGIPAAGARFPGRSAVVPVEPGQAGHGSGHNAAQASAFRQIILPDLLIVAPTGLTRTQIARLRKIAGVRDMITFDGAEITAGGRKVSVIGVNPATFRSWVPLATASNQAFWGALSNGEFVAGQSAATRLGLQPGAQYRLTGATSQDVTFGLGARLGLSGVDLLVNVPTSRKLGLVRQVAGLISAPGAGLTSLTRRVQKVLGPAGRIEVLRSRRLPVAAVAPGTRPANYLQLFKASAAEYCPGLSWTVLAAIGQIESADGTNVGPSTAGAMGPMQFLPSTWAEWGIDGFGDTGPPNILNPYDAVPSAARLLCANGAGAGGQSLSRAIFDYNHATWYVNEVLALAARYAADYR